MESHLESKSHTLPYSITNSPLHLLCTTDWLFHYQITRQEGRMVMKGLSSTTIFPPTGQESSHAKKKKCFVVSSLVPIPNSREGIRMPSLSQVSTMVQFTKFSWSGLYDSNTIIIIEDNGNGAKEKKKSLWAKQTAQKVTPTQVFCWIEGREEKKEGGRKGEKEGETNPNIFGGLPYSDREMIQPRHEIVTGVKPEG